MRNPFSQNTQPLKPLNEKDSVRSKNSKTVTPHPLYPMVRVSPERKRRLASTLFLLVLAAAAGFGGGWLGARNSGLDVMSTAAKQQIISNESQLVNSIAKNVGESVVSINVSSQTTATNFFGFSQPQSQEAAGTGILLTKEGLIITNRHVVSGDTTSVSVTLSDGTELDNVEVVGRTSSTDPLDIAFLQIKDRKGHDLRPVSLGDSSKVQVGDKVVAIGNALGQFQNTVTSGIISGFGRSIEAGDDSSAFGSSNTETLQDLFQTDAAINPGNSGGPLVNVNGEVIGINVAIANAQNIGFSIPINDVKGLVASVEKNGKLERPYLGIRYVTLTDDYAYTYNLDVKRGAYIAPGANGEPSILPDSPAEKAGLQEKDIITEIDGTKIDAAHSVVSLLGAHKVGDSVKLTVVRDGKTISINVTLGSTPVAEVQQ